MGFMRVQVSLDRDSGLPEDVVQNVFHILTPVPIAGPISEDVFDVIQLFYEQIDTYLAKTLSGAIHYKSYNLDDPTPRAPVASRDDTITPGTVDPLPAELAACLSYRADYESGEPNARRRGRIYVGPLGSNSATASPTGDVWLASTFVTLLAQAGADLRDAINSIPSSWCVYSPTTDATESLGNSFFDVVTGWVDNAYDVQRRRGSDATTREIWPA